MGATCPIPVTCTSHHLSSQDVYVCALSYASQIERVGGSHLAFATREQMTYTMDCLKVGASDATGAVPVLFDGRASTRGLLSCKYHCYRNHFSTYD